MKSFKDKVAAITGAGSGIGRQLAVQLAGQGCHLSLSDVNETGLAETVALLDSMAVRVEGLQLLSYRRSKRSWPRWA